MHQHQERLLTSVFNITDKYEFKDRLENPVSVTTWDGKTRAWMTTKQVDDMWREVCFLGPLAAMYGREVQQTLMSPNPPNKIPVKDFQYSVDMGRASLSQEKIEASWHEPVEDRPEDDQVSQTSRRTRSPRKTLYYGDIREQPDYRQSTDIRERPDYRRPTDVRDRSDHRHHGDIRERRSHTQSETRYDRNTQDRSRRR